MKYKLPAGTGSVADIIKRCEQAKKRKEHWTNTLQEAYDYAIPNRETFFEHHKGQKRTDHLFDSTAVEAVKEFVSRIQSTVIPPWRNWTRLLPGILIDEELREDKDLRENLDQATDKFFVYLNHSNFALQSAEALMDYAISTGCLMFDEGDDNQPFNFKAIPLAEVFLEEGPTTMVETVFREHEPLIRNIKNLYKGADLGEDLERKGKMDPNARCKVIEGTVYFEDLGDEPYVTVAIEVETQRLLWMTTYRTSPWIVFRSPTVPGEIYGRGPVLDMLPDIKSLNKMVEFTLEAAAFSVGPVYTAASDGIINPYTMKVRPRTVIPVGSNDTRNPSLAVLPQGGSPDFAMMKIEEIRRNIKRALFNNLRTADGPVKTATEIAIDNRELLEYMGASFGRLQTEFVERIVRRGVEILERKGLIEKLRINGSEITLQHTSPLARAQDFEEIENIERFLGTIFNLGPEVAQMNVEIIEIGRAIGHRLGVEESLLLSKSKQKQRITEQEEAAAGMITAATQGGV